MRGNTSAGGRGHSNFSGRHTDLRRTPELALIITSETTGRHCVRQATLEPVPLRYSAPLRQRRCELQFEERSGSPGTQAPHVTDPAAGAGPPLSAVGTLRVVHAYHDCWTTAPRSGGWAAGRLAPGSPTGPPWRHGHQTLPERRPGLKRLLAARPPSTRPPAGGIPPALQAILLGKLTNAGAHGR